MLPALLVENQDCATIYGCPQSAIVASRRSFLAPVLLQIRRQKHPVPQRRQSRPGDAPPSGDLGSRSHCHRFAKNGVSVRRHHARQAFRARFCKSLVPAPPSSPPAKHPSPQPPQLETPPRTSQSSGACRRPFSAIHPASQPTPCPRRTPRPPRPPPRSHPRRGPQAAPPTRRAPISPGSKPSKKTSLAIATGCRRPHPRPARSAAIVVLSGTHRRTVKRRRRHAVRAKIDERSQFFTPRGKTGSFKSITYDFRGRRRVNI